MKTALTIRPTLPGLLGRNVFDDVFDGVFNDFPTYLRQSTQGYPVADIYRTEDGSTILEFALAGFAREDLNVDVQPDKGSITVTATTGNSDELDVSRRIARRNFKKTYVNYDRNLNLNGASARFDNGLLTVVIPQRPEAKATSIKIM